MTVDVQSFSASGADASELAGQLAAQIGSGSNTDPIQGMLVFVGAGCDASKFRDVFVTHFPDTPMIGTSSHQGVGTQLGFANSPSAAALVFWGTGFGFETSFEEKTAMAPKKQGEILARSAIEQSGFSPDKTRFALLFCSPGDEQSLLNGIYEVLPGDVPILGGGIAGENFSPHWRVWNQLKESQSAAVLAVCDWPWALQAHFESGYLVAGPKGRATCITDSRILHTIDDRPAAVVYNEWMKGALQDKLNGGSILAETTLKPLGVATKNEGPFKSFLLIHPEEILPDKSIRLFASVNEGDELHLMFSQAESLVNRTKRLTKVGFDRARFGRDDLVGSLLIYCAGCLAAIENRADEMLTHYREASPAPFVAGFTFGEVGCISPGVYGHGNLMAGTLLLSNKSI